nr:adenosylcobinamide-GDP ribazoletransferase [Butyrivibrio sp. WCE2006]
MKIFRWLAVTFSMYSKIPMPVFEWKEDDMAHSLTFFTFVGAVMGAVVLLLNSFDPLMKLPVAVRIILTILTPILITGGFHLDGFMDTEDALNSYASKERKLEILKDSHIGAFAVISLLKWYLIYAAAVTAILLSPKCDTRLIVILGLTFVISRAASAFTSLTFKKAKKEGMLYEETKNNQKGTVFFNLFIFLISCGGMIYAKPLYGAATVLAFLAHTLYYKRKIYKEFGGVTGDTAGFFVTTGEIVTAAVLAIVVYL